MCVIFYKCFLPSEHVRSNWCLMRQQHCKMLSIKIRLFGFGIFLLFKLADGSSTNFMGMTDGQSTGNIVASTQARSLISCAADCLAFQTEIFEYQAPVCSCYDGSSSGASFVAAGHTSFVYGKVQVLVFFNAIYMMI